MTDNNAYYQLMGLLEFLKIMKEVEGENAKVLCSDMENALKKVVKELEEK